MSWYKVSFSNSDVVAGKAIKAQDYFTELFISFKAPKKLALFSVDEKDLGSVYYLHIPDEFPQFASVYSTKFPLSKCDKPTSNKIYFLAGHNEDISLAKE